MDREREVLQHGIQVGAVRRPPGSGAANGFEVHSVNSRKPKLTSPMTPSTRLEKLRGRER